MLGDGTEILSGAAFSGEQEKPVRLRIEVCENVDQLNESSHEFTEYELDAQGRRGEIKEREA